MADQLPDVPDDELPEEKRRGNWHTPTVKCLITQHKYTYGSLILTITKLSLI